MYECEQIGGPHKGPYGVCSLLRIRTCRTSLLILFRIPYDSSPNEDPAERPKEASGMQLNDYMEDENEILEILTTAGCSTTSTLLAVQIDTQDESILESTEEDIS